MTKNQAAATSAPSLSKFRKLIYFSSVFPKKSNVAAFSSFNFVILAYSQHKLGKLRNNG